MIRVLLTASALLLAPSLAYAQDQTPEAEILSEKIEDKLADHTPRLARSAARLKRDYERATKDADGDVAQELEAAADMLEDVFSDKGLFRDVVAMLGDFAEEVDVDTEDGKTVLSFDGAEIARFDKDKQRDSRDKVEMSALGHDLTLERETVVKDGKSKTRLTIDLGDGDTIDLTLPNTDEILDEK